MTIPPLELLRCPVCEGGLRDQATRLFCPRCGGSYPVEDGLIRMLDDRLPGIREKRAEVAGWVELARRQGWYAPDDEVDAVLPHVSRLGWDDENWRANEHSFELLLERWVRPGMRVLEVGAAKCWGAQHLLPRGCEYVAADILDDPVIGLGRGAFYAERVGEFPRVQADGERLPFADGAFDLAYCLATLHHALDLRGMVRELARVTRPGGAVAALNEGTRGTVRSGSNPRQAEERELGINEHVHTVWAYVWAFARAGLRVRALEHAEGYDALAGGRVFRRLLRLPGGRALAAVYAQERLGYGGVSIYASRP